MKTVVIERLQNGGVSIIVNNGIPRTIENPSNLVIRPLPDSEGCIIKLADESWRQTLYLEDTITINGDPAPVLLSELITVLANDVFSGSSSYETPTKLAQTITFAGPADMPAISAPIDLEASSTSGLPVAFASSDDLVFTIAGNVLTPVGAGTANITASQAGNNIYSAADDVVHPLTLT